MAISIEHNAELIRSKISGFRNAWNNSDVGALNTYVSKSIICKHPAVHIGFVNIVKEDHYGYFKVLKFWHQILNDFNASVEDVEIHDIEYTPSGYRVHCVGHYPYMELSGKFIVDFDAKYIIERIEFTRVTNYRVDLEVSSLGLVVKYLKIRSKKLFA